MAAAVVGLHRWSPGWQRRRSAHLGQVIVGACPSRLALRPRALRCGAWSRSHPRRRRPARRSPQRCPGLAVRRSKASPTTSDTHASGFDEQQSPRRRPAYSSDLSGDRRRSCGRRRPGGSTPRPARAFGVLLDFADRLDVAQLRTAAARARYLLDRDAARRLARDEDAQQDARGSYLVEDPMTGSGMASSRCHRSRARSSTRALEVLASRSPPRTARRTRARPATTCGRLRRVRSAADVRVAR